MCNPSILTGHQTFHCRRSSHYYKYFTIVMYSMEELCALVNIKCVGGKYKSEAESTDSSEEVDSAKSEDVVPVEIQFENEEAAVEDSSVGEMEDALDSSWTLQLDSSPGADESRGVEHVSNVVMPTVPSRLCRVLQMVTNQDRSGVGDDFSSADEDPPDLTWTPKDDQNDDSPGAAESGYEGGGVEHDSNVEDDDDFSSGEEEDQLDPNWTPERDHNSDSPGDSGNEGVELEEDSSCGDAGLGLGEQRKRRHPQSWKANIQKRRRMSGKSYLGRENQEPVLKEERKMGVSCQSAACRKSAKLHCGEIEEKRREEIFKYFWEKLDWRERKIYVKSLAEVSSVKRRRAEAETFRRSASIFYHLVIDGRRLRVCQRMFLSTLGLKQWALLHWIGRRGNGSTQEAKQVTVRREEVDFLKTFLQDLPKVPSHYCRSSSSKMYLEPVFQSIKRLHAEYTRSSAEHGIQALSRQVFTRMFKDLNLSLYHPKKDQCDTCCAFKAGNIDAVAWKDHCTKKDSARAMKQKDKEEAGEKTLVTCMDLQGLLLCPKLQASSLYYKTKLCVHNFTIYDMISHEASNYLWHEGEAGISANEFASCIVHFLKEHPSYEEYILWSDGCGYQNRNLLLSNALLKFAMETQKTVTQKFLERGHTQMECDSVHSVIERRLRNRDVSVPAEYAVAIRQARSNPTPYHVKYVDHTFFMNFSSVNLCKSIRPGKVAGDPTVHDLRAIRYNMDGSMEYKIAHSDGWKPYESPSLRKKSSITTVTSLYTSRRLIKAMKFRHLQEMKLVLHKDFHAFYDGLRHEEPEE